MPAILLFLFVVVPLAEIAVLIRVGREIGALWTICLLVLFSVAGAVIAKREGMAVWRRFRASLERGETPAAEIADGFLVLLGGALLLTPGFLTDALGLTLLFPVTRAGIKSGLRRAAGWYLSLRFPVLAAFRDTASGPRPNRKVIRAEAEGNGGEATEVRRDKP